MTEQTVSHYEDDEISLLDILVTLAESWKLLVFGPLFAAVLVGALSFFLPKTFESTAIVRLTEAEVTLLGANPVLDSLIVKFDLLTEFDGDQDEARDYLVRKVSGKFDKKTGLSTITARAATPERAQAMLAAGIDALLLELVPKGKTKDQIEQTIQRNERVILNNVDAVEQLKKQMGKAGQGEGGLEVVMKHYASLSAEVANKELENIELKKNLTIKGIEVFVQQPSKPQRKTSPKTSVLILLAMLVAGFALVLFVFVRKAYSSICKQKEAADKIARIRLLLKF